MPDILLRDVSKGELKFEAREGETLLSAFGRAGIPVSAPCGGKHRCGKCKVKILQGRVRDIFTDENNVNSEGAAALPKDTVLACRSIPETPVTAALVLEDSYEEGAYDRISSSGEDFGRISRAAVALDVGTTTVSACLIDLDTGREAASYSALNQQRVFGADVMSRISAAREGKTGELFEIIKRQTRELISGFLEKSGLSSIETLVVAANTTMLHLFANEDPSAMGEIPFTPVFLEGREYSGKDLSLPAEKVMLLPSISAFIGGDIVSGLMLLNILESNETVFFIDIGTNGEMALFHEGKLYCASAAAGPALEGAEISCGVGSIRGAVNKVEWKDGCLSWNVIGGDDAYGLPAGNPVGICGCGLIDAVAVILDQGIIDETGAFSDDCKDFQIAPGVSLNGRDIRQFQLAKSAILSAIKIVFRKAGLELSEVKKVYAAGGLGFYIDQRAAVRTGLFPKEFLGRIEVCGNASLKGAIKALLSPDFAEYCKRIKDAAVTIDIASDPAFMDEFAENMLF
ncbi:MAG: ASKHA domain-containing protein [Treponema sp.]|nr:ASKHA domain-containing protein [Treponema sp.]